MHNKHLSEFIMHNYRFVFIIIALTALCSVTHAQTRIYEMKKFGLKADSKKNAAPVIQKALDKIKTQCHSTDSIILRLEPGRYHFYEKGAIEREYYISNHDQTNPKKIGITLEKLKHFTLDGQGAEFIFHGRMLPLSLLHSENCTLKNFSIDFENPHITQVQIIENTPDKGVVFKVADYVKYRITETNEFEAYGDSWTTRPSTGIAFEEKTKRVVYRTSDLTFSTRGIQEKAPGILQAPAWKDSRLIPGTVVAMRTYERPAPGLFLAHNVNTRLENIQIHYAEGMGLLAQLCENITLDHFSVCLRGENDTRYFTTQADATHFSGCKGKIISCNGLYEGMMDDAINVHGTYLKIVKRINDTTVVGRYMHPQTWGFEWGCQGDQVQFVRSATMDLIGKENRITSIRPYDKNEIQGAHEFIITLAHAIDTTIHEKTGFGIENLTWTPQVIFSGNTIRNNRARGALFSTPQDVLVENNLFDHTSGTAILLCGDCNGWYETGACRNVTIRNNRFINALTSLFQFTNAIISIYPEIPNLQAQQNYFHGTVIIENNLFNTFDAPIVYGKSVNTIIFRHNTIQKNRSYFPFHWNRHRFFFERVNNVMIAD